MQADERALTVGMAGMVVTAVGVRAAHYVGVLSPGWALALFLALTSAILLYVGWRVARFEGLPLGEVLRRGLPARRRRRRRR